MITSDRQLASAKRQLARLMEARAAPTRSDVPQAFIDGAHQKLDADIETINTKIQEYESLKNLSVDDIQIHSFDELLTAPIRYRLVARLTVDEFAKQVEINPRNIQRYEASEYRSVNISILKGIFEKLKLHMSGKFIF